MHIHTLCRAALAVLFVVLAAAQSAATHPARAQGGDDLELVVHGKPAARENEQDIDGNPAFTVKLLYSVQNTVDKSVLSAEKIQGSSLLIDGRVVQAETDEAVESDDWNIVLLTDMTDAGAQDDSRQLKDARAALAQMLESGPQAKYAWYDFNDALRTRQEEFKPLKGEQQQGNQKDTSIPSLLATPIVPTLKKACVNKAVLDAVRKLKTAPGRKAVLLFTHQVDACGGETSLQQVLDEATQSPSKDQQVQIFAIGLGGDNLRDELQKLANPTGGAAFAEDSNSFRGGVDQLFKLMKGQREASFILYPKKGAQKVTLRALMADNTTQAAVVEFQSQFNYAPPPRLDFRNAASKPDGVDIILRAESPAKIKGMRLRIIDTSTSDVVYDRPFESLGDVFGDKAEQKITIPRVEGAKELKRGGNYQIVIEYVLPTGERRLVFPDDKPQTFQYQPDPPTLRIEGRGPSPLTKSFVVTVTANTNNTLVDVFLVTQEGAEKPVTQREQRTLIENTPQRLEFAIGDLPEGVYRGRVEWSGVSEVFSLTDDLAWRSETLLERIVREAGASSGTRIALIAIAALALVGIVLLIGLFRARGVSQVKVVRGEGMGAQRIRRININLPQTGRFSASGKAGKSDADKAALGAEGAPLKKEVKARAPIEANPPPPPVRNSQRAAQPGDPKPREAAPGLAVAPAQIRVIKPDGIMFKGRVKKTPFTIGRDPSNDGALPVASDSGVSRKHITLSYVGGQWRVRDDGTANGTKVNGARIAAGQDVPLPNGAILALGSVEIEFSLALPAGPAN